MFAYILAQITDLWNWLGTFDITLWGNTSISMRSLILGDIMLGLILWLFFPKTGGDDDD